MNLGLIHPSLLTQLTNFYPSTCTIQESTETNTKGQRSLAWANVAGQVNIPCRVAPATSDRSREMKLPDMTYAIWSHTIALRGRYVGIIMKMRAVESGVDWDILAVDYDDQEESTYLRVRVVT